MSSVIHGSALKIHLIQQQSLPKKANTGIMRGFSYCFHSKKKERKFFEAFTHTVFYEVSAENKLQFSLRAGLWRESPPSWGRGGLFRIGLSCTRTAGCPPGAQCPLCKSQQIIAGLWRWWPEPVPPPPLLKVIPLFHPVGNNTQGSADSAYRQAISAVKTHNGHFLLFVAGQRHCRTLYFLYRSFFIETYV